ncbi:hypothetical protein BEWA_046110 [Theileria equi strain WA]|uniref:Uncharacterized protein n=1 Tax=Theileria equi strain WA TaxID=1537102 RepID=L1L9P3_THEEQ|nr:hypothetical protein BEWA_046110 [Theileria equi strain WA]EKX72147.1 hypothetical protein BEWA_046110 [Theileria equi strain WA]|eukprot:XP_004831599.1 hypothetical protein BEWA_046110 [Theileria equi strain WA]
MSQKGIDIKYKCPSNQTSSTGTCKDDQSIQADKGNLEGAPYYGYVTHSSTGKRIGTLTYGGRSLEIEDGKRTAFSTKYHNLEKVTTYYYTKNDNSSDNINVPLILRIFNRGGPYYLYLNLGGDHTKWKRVPLSDNFKIPTDNTTNKELTNILESQTCILYKLHKIDICNDGNSDINPYTCPVCDKATVWSNAERHVNSIDCYKIFCHVLLDDGNKIIHPVTYENELIVYRNNATNKWKPLSVSKSDCDYLSVYYWEGDSKRNNPLLIEVKFSGKSTWYENKSAGGNNKIWNKVQDQYKGVLATENGLKTKLDYLNCTLNNAVRINLGLDSGCHDSRDSNHKSRIKTRHNGTVDKALLLSAYEYTSSEHGGGPFSVAESFVQDARQIFGNTKFFKGIAKVIVYASSCDATNPFLLCIESNCNEYKWYWKTKLGNNWELYPQFSKQSPKDVKSQIGGIFNSVKDPLGVKPCPTKTPPSTGLKLDIKRQPTGDELESIYYDSSSDDIPILVTKDTNNLPKGFFRVTHQTTSDIGHFTVSNTLKDGDGIRRSKRSVDCVSVYFGSSKPDLPILLEVKDETNETKYYSRTEVTGTSQGNWAQQNDYDKLTSNELNDMLDDQNGKRNSTIPIDLKTPEVLEPFYKAIKVKTTTTPHLEKRRYVTPLLPGPELPQGARKDYEVKSYLIESGQGAKISRVVYGSNETTGIEPPKDKVSQLRIYQWKNDSSLPDKVPLLVEFISSGKSEWFENLDKKSLAWQGADSKDSQKFYKSTSPPQYPYQFDPSFTNELDKVSCHIHHTVSINISKNSGMLYCHDMCKSRRIKVDKEKGGIFYGYTGYEHTSAIKGQDNFTLTSIVYNKKKQNVNNNVEFPLKDVKQVTVYFPVCNPMVPVMIYINYDVTKNNSHGKSMWLKNEDKEGNWDNVSSTIPGDDKENLIKEAIQKILDGVKSNLNLCPGSPKESKSHSQPHSDGGPAGELGTYPEISNEEDVNEQEEKEEEEEDEDKASSEDDDSTQAETLKPKSLLPAKSQSVGKVGARGDTGKELFKAIGETVRFGSTIADLTLGLVKDVFASRSPDQTTAKALAQSSDSTLGDGLARSGEAPEEKSPDIKTISIITSSVLGASGSLTGFGWWIYKRSKGDPWVRQI